MIGYKVHTRKVVESVQPVFFGHTSLPSPLQYPRPRRCSLLYLSSGRSTFKNMEERKLIQEFDKFEKP